MGVLGHGASARRRWSVLLVPVVVLVFGAVLTTPAAASTPGSSGASPTLPAAPVVVHGGGYVALGDSFAAGPLIPHPTGLPIGCLRSTANYPQVVGAALGGGVVDVSCSGARTDDLLAPQGTVAGTAPAQVDALSERTQVVTVTIGGNDIGFVEILTECAKISITDPLGAACRALFTVDGTDELTDRIAATAPAVAGVLDAITARAPWARVALVGYPALLPERGHCFPNVPFSPGDVAYLRGVTQQLNAMLAAEADAAGVLFVDTYGPSIGHDMCAPPEQRWIEPLVPSSPAAPVHPNAAGMRGVAGPVIAALSPSVVLAGG